MDFVHSLDRENIFLKLPHALKPLQALNAIILAICIGSTAGEDNGVLWFVIICSLLISAAATVIFAMRIQDQLLENISNGSITWNIVEMVYSFVLSVLCAISVWLSFGFANRGTGGASAGYIAAGLFFIGQTALYAVPCVMIYDAVQANGIRGNEHNVQVAHPFNEPSYQDL